MIKLKKLTIRLTEKKHRALKRYAANSGMTIQAIINQAVDAWFAGEEKKVKTP